MVGLYLAHACFDSYACKLYYGERRTAFLRASRRPSHHHCVCCRAGRIAQRPICTRIPACAKGTRTSDRSSRRRCWVTACAAVAVVLPVAAVGAYHLGKDRAGLIDIETLARLRGSRQKVDAECGNGSHCTTFGSSAIISACSFSSPALLCWCRSSRLLRALSGLLRRTIC